MWDNVLKGSILEVRIKLLLKKLFSNGFKSQNKKMWLKRGWMTLLCCMVFQRPLGCITVARFERNKKRFQIGW